MHLCRRCGSAIVKKPGPGRWPHWCSDECRRPAAREVERAKRPAPWQSNCSECSRPIRTGARFCASEECARTGNRVRSREASAARAPRSYTIACVMCSAAFSSSNKLRRFCSTECQYRSNYMARRARRLGVRREPYALSAVIEHSQGICALCDEPIDLTLAYPHRRSASIDHVLPLSRGGADTIGNVQLAHLECNWTKGPRVSIDP